MSRTTGPCALLCTLLLANSALAAPEYPVSARLTLAPPEQQQCLSVQGERDCDVVGIVRDAFAGAVSRMFKPGVDPDLTLVLEVHGADIAFTGQNVEISTRVRVLTPGGEQIDQIASYGVGMVLALQKGLVTAAERTAADEAAHEFERSYWNSSRIGDYLVSRKLAPAAVVAVPPRSDRLFTTGVGLAIVQGGGDGDVTPAPSLHVALASGPLFVRATYSRYTSSFQSADGLKSVSANLTTNDVGLDAGGVLRLTPGIELHGGPGIHYLSGDAAAESATPGLSTSFEKPVLTLHASVSTSFIPFRNWPRSVVGLDFHGYFSSTIELPALSRRVPAANTSLSLFVGIELPLGLKQETPRSPP